MVYLSTMTKMRELTKRMIKMRQYYFLILPMIVFFVIFCYVPMYGVVLAFKDYQFSSGILGSPWVGFKHFEVVSNPLFAQAFWNTVIISFYRIIFGFPAPIILALIFNEVSNLKFKKLAQTISYMPYFISWVVLAGIIIEMLSPSRGIVNYMLMLFGGKSVYFLTEPIYFRSILISTGIWQSIGWNSVIYLAAISGINTEMYESGYIDGARRFQTIRYITLPSIKHVIIILFILGLGGILNAGFDQIFNLYNPMVYSTGDIIDTYIYRVGLINMDYSTSTAVNLFKNLIGLCLVLFANFIVKHIGEGEFSIW